MTSPEALRRAMGMADRYLRGESCRLIGERYGCDASTVRRILKRYGVVLRSPNDTTATVAIARKARQAAGGRVLQERARSRPERARAVALRRERRTVREIAKALEVAERTVSRWLRQDIPDEHAAIGRALDREARQRRQVHPAFAAAGAKTRDATLARGRVTQRRNQASRDAKHIILVRAFHREGWPVRRIARQIGIGRGTVARIIRTDPALASEGWATC